MPRHHLTSPYQNEVGFVSSRVNTLTGEHCILYDGQRAAFDTSHGRWANVCSKHGTIHFSTNKKIATSLLSKPTAWCEACANLADIEEAEYILTLRAIRSTDEQLKRLATLAIGHPEKCSLFQRLTGVAPETFLEKNTQ